MRWLTPTPIAQRALPSITDARKALERGEQALSTTQVEDAIRSAEFFIKAAREAMAAQATPQPLTSRGGPIAHIPQPT